MCNPANGQCVQCLTNMTCPMTRPICVAGTCEVCGTSADCTMGRVCEPSTHTCRASCAGDGGVMCGAFGGGNICDMATGACVGCVTATNCMNANRPICDPTTQQCVQCATNANCANNPNGKVCDTGNNTCVVCVTAADCGTGMQCNQFTHTCRAGCTTNMQCAGMAGGALPICDTATGACVECTMASQCMGAGATCVGNVCMAGAGMTCNMNSDCSADGGGATPYCTGQGGNCVQCIARRQCPNACVNNRCF
jgi:hypothetical protein